MSQTRTLFDSVKLGDITLSNRIAMAPLTRNRAVAASCRTRWRRNITPSALRPDC